MLTKKKFSWMLVVFLLASAQAAFAGLSAVGPVNPVPAPGNGFPQWYTDANGVSVDLPIPPLGAPPPAVVIPTMIFSAVDPNFPYSAQTGFGAEAFYFNATSPKTFQTKWGKVTALMGLEAGYANLVPTAGQQQVFARIRLTAPNIQVAGTYTFSHPWGVETINVTTADLNQNAGKGIKFTKDVGIGAGWITNADGTFTLVPAPLGFNQVLGAGNTMSTFLTAVNPLPPAGWIGDGVTAATFTGSPIAYNKIRLDAPAGTDLDGKGHSFIESTQLVISGHIAPNTTVPIAFTLDRLTCSHFGTQESIDVWLTSVPGAAIEVRDALAGPTSIPIMTGSVTSVTGKFYKSFIPAAPAPDAVIVTVSDPLGAASPSSKTVNVVDYVNITTAKYSVGTNTLTIQATSSDWFKHPTTPPTLTAVGFGTLTFNNLGVATLVVPVTGVLPPVITVNSQLNKGTATTPVLVPGGSDTAQTAIAP